MPTPSPLEEIVKIWKDELPYGFDTFLEFSKASGSRFINEPKFDAALIRVVRAAAIREERERLRKIFSNRLGLTIDPINLAFQEQYFKKSDVLAALEPKQQEDEA